MPRNIWCWFQKKTTSASQKRSPRSKWIRAKPCSWLLQTSFWTSWCFFVWNQMSPMYLDLPAHTKPSCPHQNPIAMTITSHRYSYPKKQILWVDFYWSSLPAATDTVAPATRDSPSPCSIALSADQWQGVPDANARTPKDVCWFVKHKVHIPSYTLLLFYSPLKGWKETSWLILQHMLIVKIRSSVLVGKLKENSLSLRDALESELPPSK